ncbi:hypothetical protein Tco_1071792 [Tanacetum coccineum]
MHPPSCRQAEESGRPPPRDDATSTIACSPPLMSEQGRAPTHPRRSSSKPRTVGSDPETPARKCNQRTSRRVIRGAKRRPNAPTDFSARRAAPMYYTVMSALGAPGLRVIHRNGADEIRGGIVEIGILKDRSAQEPTLPEAPSLPSADLPCADRQLALGPWVTIHNGVSHYQLELPYFAARADLSSVARHRPVPSSMRRKKEQQAIPRNWRPERPIGLEMRSESRNNGKDRRSKSRESDKGGVSVPAMVRETATGGTYPMTGLSLRMDGIRSSSMRITRMTHTRKFTLASKELDLEDKTKNGLYADLEHEVKEK